MKRLRERWLVKHNIIVVVVAAAIASLAIFESEVIRTIAYLVLFAPLYWKTHFQDDLVRRW